MCLQCTVNAERLGTVLPGWALYRSHGDDPRWPRGHWGLVRSNDPDFVWETTPTPDPLHDVPDDQWEAFFDANPKGSAAYERTMNFEHPDFDAAIVCEPALGWELVQAAIPHGYDPETTGDFSQWFFSLLGIRLRDGFLPDPEPKLQEDTPDE